MFLSRGAPQGTRTPDLLVRSQTLYPAELAAQVAVNSFIIISYYFLFVKCFSKYFVELNYDNF